MSLYLETFYNFYTAPFPFHSCSFCINLIHAVEAKLFNLISKALLPLNVVVSSLFPNSVSHLLGGFVLMVSFAHYRMTSFSVRDFTDSSSLWYDCVLTALIELEGPAYCEWY